MSKKWIPIIVVFLVIVSIGIGLFVYQSKFKSGNLVKEIEQSKNKYEAFYSEAYSTIQDNYWEKLNDDHFGKLWILAAEKITGKAQNEIKDINKEKVVSLMKDLTNEYSDESQKKQFAGTLVDMVLSNLQPFGRSRLYTQKEEKALSNTVQNKSEVDQYQALATISILTQSYF